MKTLTQPRPMREECRELYRTIIRAERDRDKERPGDTAKDCAHYAPMIGMSWGHCAATPLDPGVHPSGRCPQTCPCFRRRAS
jgi:hypothetical protein